MDTVQVVIVAMRMHILDHTLIRPGHGRNKVPLRPASISTALLPARQRLAEVAVEVEARRVADIPQRGAVQIPLEDPLHQLPLALGNGAFDSKS
jgi:hypothetical protein